MRAYPHKPDRGSIEDDLSMALSLMDTDEALFKKAAKGGNRQFFLVNAEQAGSAAAYAYALERPLKEVHRHMRTAVADWGGALAAGAALDPDQYIHALGMALVAGEAKEAASLAALGREKYTNPAVGMSEVAYQVAEALGELARGGSGGGGSEGRAATLEGAVKQQPDRPVPEVADLAAPIALAALRGDGAALQKSVERHAAGYVKIFKKAAMRQHPDSFFDIWGLGLLCVAGRRGMSLPGGNPYLPTALIVG